MVFKVKTNGGAPDSECDGRSEQNTQDRSLEMVRDRLWARRHKSGTKKEDEDAIMSVDCSERSLTSLSGSAPSLFHDLPPLLNVRGR